MFKDRHDAARQLLAKLTQYQDQHPLILGIPRGGMVLAAPLARGLHGDLDVMMVRKIGAPGHAEYGIGCVSEEGYIYLSDEGQRADSDYIDATVRREMETMRERRRRYAAFHASVDPRNRVVIIVDDGVATGATLICAIHALRAAQAKKIVAAIPVAPPDTASQIRDIVDDCIVLETPEPFLGVGQFYQNFDEVSNAEVIRLLAVSQEKNAC